MSLKNEKISLIVPVYNVAEYLPRCLDSILSQSYSNFEVVIIEDGSQDASGTICDEYIKKDSRVRVYHVPNGGVAKARNFGLSHIEGEWFGYVDADDWLEPDYLQALYDMACEEKCDVVACRYQRDSQFCMLGEKQEEKRRVLQGSEECIKNYILSKNSLNGMIWNKLYRAEVFQSIAFDPRLKVNEDCLYTLRIMQKCKKACLSTKILYHWFQREGSACHNRPKEFDLSSADVFLTILNETEKLNDKAVSHKLQENYVKLASHILFFAKYKRKNEVAQEAIQRIRIMKKDVWKCLDMNHRVKVITVLYFPFLLPMIRKVLC